MFKSIAIIGLGLIGSSLARAIRRYRLADRLIGVDTDAKVLDTVRKLDLVDEYQAHLAETIASVEMAIVCTPLGTYSQIASDLRRLLNPGVIVTDVGSVKRLALAAFGATLSAENPFVPAHPVAGTERSGPAAGFAELFYRQWCILTPEDPNAAAVERVSAFWRACGSRIEIMDAIHHDRILALMSHIPHLIAYTIVGTAMDLYKFIPLSSPAAHHDEEILKFAAGGFREFTRIAASNPVMWRDIFTSNREFILEILQRFTEDLTDLQRLIRRSEEKTLEKKLRRTRKVQKELIRLRQHTAYLHPDSQRKR